LSCLTLAKHLVSSLLSILSNPGQASFLTLAMQLVYIYPNILYYLN